MKKKCWVCKREKDLSEFGKDSKGIDGVRRYCRSCAVIADKYKGVRQMRLAYLLEEEKRKYKRCIKSLSELYLETEKGA